MKNNNRTIFKKNELMVSVNIFLSWGIMLIACGTMFIYLGVKNQENAVMMVGLGLILTSIIFFVLYFKKLPAAKAEQKRIDEETKKQLDEELRQKQLEEEMRLKRISDEKNLMDMLREKSSNNFNDIIFFNTDDKAIYIVDKDNIKYKEILFKDIVSTEIITKEKTTTNVKKDKNYGKALVGGALFGVAGAIIMSDDGQRVVSNTTITDLNLKIVIKDFDNPIITIPFISNCRVSEYLGEKNPFTEIEKLEGIFKVIKNG